MPQRPYSWRLPWCISANDDDERGDRQRDQLSAYVNEYNLACDRSSFCPSSRSFLIESSGGRIGWEHRGAGLGIAMPPLK